MPERTMVEALNLAMDQCMERDHSVCMMGEDIGINGGVFRVTKDLQAKYGSKRVMDAPLAECGIIGTAVGMAVHGMRPVAEIQFSGFTMQAMDQIEQNMARLHNRTQGRYKIAMVMRTPFGGGFTDFRSFIALASMATDVTVTSCGPFCTLASTSPILGADRKRTSSVTRGLYLKHTAS